MGAEFQAKHARRGGSVTIANAASLSGAIETHFASRVLICVPTIASAAITFQVSPDGTTFYDLWYMDGNGSGHEVWVGASTGGKAFEIPELAGWHSIKVRSGTSASPVNQSGGDTIQVLVVDEVIGGPNG